MKSSVIVVGSKGRVSLQLQKGFTEKNISFVVWGSKQKFLPEWKKALGIIDFSTPEASLKICEEASQSGLPYVCGTTGWNNAQKDKVFAAAAKKIPIVLDSNFSRGIEILCQISELLVKNGIQKFSITDIHREEKKDAPSGTALKIKDRIQSKSKKTGVDIQSIRLGDIPGEHRLMVSFEDQVIEVSHMAQSRRAFADGAYSALLWAKNQKPGLYTMEDVLK